MTPIGSRSHKLPMLYPMKHHPVFHCFPYGGRRFVSQLSKKDAPNRRDVAESWEISDLGEYQSRVANGPLRGSTLRQLMERFQSRLVGEEVWAVYGDYFPLLVKFLDCDKRLPAHMHPSDEDARRLGLSGSGKAEAWYIVTAEPGAMAYYGSLPGLSPESFRQAIACGDNYDGVMVKVPVRAGQTYFVPAGRLHALDAGCLAYEIQQNSLAGFGWDWAGFVEAGVIPADEAARHPELAIQCATYEDGERQDVAPITARPPATCSGHAERVLCAACRYFVLERWSFSEALSFFDAAPRFNTFTVINGSVRVEGHGEEVAAGLGESILLPALVPANFQSVEVGNPAVLLRSYVPQLRRDVIEPLRAEGCPREAILSLGSYGQGNDLKRIL